MALSMSLEGVEFEVLGKKRPREELMLAPKK